MLQWTSATGALVFTEKRRLTIRAADDSWSLLFETVMRNASGADATVVTAAAVAAELNPGPKHPAPWFVGTPNFTGPGPAPFPFEARDVAAGEKFRFAYTAVFGRG